VIHPVSRVLGLDLVALDMREVVPSRMLGVVHALLESSRGAVQADVRVELPALRAGAMRENDHRVLPVDAAEGP
jgi:hypothetical protein